MAKLADEEGPGGRCELVLALWEPWNNWGVTKAGSPLC